MRGLTEPRVSLADWPVKRPKSWLAELNRPLPAEAAEALWRCVNRGRPLGPNDWAKRTSAKLGLESTLSHVGRA